MQKVMQAIFLLFKKRSPAQRSYKRKTRGQSLVEVAIAFPVLIMLFTGVVEFGFIINFYLSLLDATRDAARYYSGGDPLDAKLFDGTHGADTFYYETAYMVQRTLDPLIDDVNYRGRRIILTPARDDVIVSVYRAKDNAVTPVRSSYHLFPTAGDTNGNYPSVLTAAALASGRVANVPNAGILVVEIHYNYRHVLSLPWMTAWLPNPLHLQAYSIMPLRAVEPK